MRKGETQENILGESDQLREPRQVAIHREGQRGLELDPESVY